MKACVLCNGTVSFYSLPELSPAFPNKEPTGVQWIGGFDENEGRDNPEGTVVMIANTRRILQVRVGEKLRPIKNNIEYPGCLKSSRRDTIACVADDKGYALLDVEHQQKIPLFPISSISTPDVEEDRRSPSPRNETASPSGHGRSTSMGTLVGNTLAKRGRSAVHERDSRYLRPPDIGQQLASPSPSRKESSNTPAVRPTARPRSSTEVIPTIPSRQTSPEKQVVHPKPHILSPFPSEFMLTTGTVDGEPGVGMFVNLDGDVVRGTIEFSTYPDAVLADNLSSDVRGTLSAEADQIVVALLRRSVDGEQVRGLELQHVTNDTSNNTPRKAWLPILSAMEQPTAGLHQSLSTISHGFSGVGALLQSVRLKFPTPPASVETLNDERTQASVAQQEQEKALFESPTDLGEADKKRAEEELKFAGRLGKTASRALAWSGHDLWHILINPLILQLESRLLTVSSANSEEVAPKDVNAARVYALLAEIRDHEPRDETEFLGLNYTRQKASLLLFLHFLAVLQAGESVEDSTLRSVENALHESALDPRVVLLLVKPLSAEVQPGSSGIWLHRGIVEMITRMTINVETFEALPTDFWMMVRHYLTVWQEKRGYGSISDEKLVFDSVDNALIHVLLYLDKALTNDSGAHKSVKTKLNNVVDHWKGDFDRAVMLLERYHRLFVLSRLYQSKKLARDVLKTWKRIVDGEGDVDYGSNPEGIEMQMRRYLTVIRDTSLVEEYSVWLANRNPNLAIQVFTDDSSRTKFSPQQVTSLLKEHAPGAVQPYLEHLVFGKHLNQYSDDLIGYYLDSVLSVLERSEDARGSLAQTYSTYRALTSPKPTYLTFITQNAPDAPWWQSRLRLLQLLGSGGYATTSSTSKELTYSIPMVLERLAPFSSYLVSESIILDARQGRHKEALKLLTHGLGDYDTAVRYCYFGGPAPSQTIDASMLPSKQVQQDLFSYLFYEFLRIEDVEDRLEQTSHMLGKFATWFDPLHVFESIPDDWGVDMLAEFLLRSMRAATSERNEAVIMKALSAAQNLQRQAQFVDACEKLGAKIEAEKGSDGGAAPVTPQQVELDI